MFSLTVFASIFDNKTDTRVDFDTFEEFEKSLYYLSTLPGYKAKRGERKKSSPLISPAVYAPDTTRANKNVVEWASWAALDVDNQVFEGDLQEELMKLHPDIYFVCYSTASSTVDLPKFRLVFPLDRSVKSDEIQHFWYALNAEFGMAADAQTKDLSRMFYVPAQYPNAHNFIFTHKADKYLDVTSLLARHPWTAPSTSDSFFDRLPEELQKEVIQHRQAKLVSEARDFTWTSYVDCPFVNKKLVNEYKTIARIDGSGRYAMIYKIMTSIACSAVKHKYPINEYEIVDLVRALDRETSNRYANRPLNVEASRAIEFAYRNVT